MTTPSTQRTPSAPDVLAPARLGPVTLRNRVIKSATFEGKAPGALVSDELIDFHVAVAEGGVGMTTVAYCAVAPEGRTELNQIYWRPEALPGLRKLTDAVHKTGAKVSAQIGHAGPVANAASTKMTALAPTRMFGPQAMAFTRAADEDDIQRIITAHADAAWYAHEVGFDAVEVHFGHNYLVSSFLNPALNRRTDSWGGSLENRARFARLIAEAIRKRVGNKIAVLAKVNMEDGVEGGFTVSESISFAKMLEADGHLDALELTGGSSLKNPMYLFRGDVPLEQMADSQGPLLGLGMRIFGRLLFKSYPYERTYFLEQARQFRAALHMPLILLGGITDAAAMDTAMSEGFEFVAMGRALLREPDLINKIVADRSTQSKCTHCNRCVPTIFSGTHCPLIAEEAQAAAR
ncbi:NADH:flavin oxidoreductase [Archangium violaceum]|nr:NADH:flavin oxidoreductase [Archangium violaceum]